MLMRFIGWDSWSPFEDGGFNGYGYGKGDPMNGDDRSGHMFNTRKYPLLTARSAAAKLKTNPEVSKAVSTSAARGRSPEVKVAGTPINKNQRSRQPSPKPDYDDDICLAYKKVNRRRHLRNRREKYERGTCKKRSIRRKKEARETNVT